MPTSVPCQCSDCVARRRELGIPEDGSGDADYGLELYGDPYDDVEDEPMPRGTFRPDNPGGTESSSDDVTARAEDDAPPPGTLLEPIGTRAPRLVSFEQEIGGDGHALAAALFEEGHSQYDRMRGYHSSDGRGWLHVEDDSSVDGEVIYSRLRLNRRGVARQVEQALGVVQDHIAEGTVSLDQRCGFHVHVGLGFDVLPSSGNPIRAYSMDQVRSLYHLWNYCEDTVFRLASANWKRHRSDHGNNYAPETDKSLSDSNRRNMGDTLANYRGALNLSPYLNARHNCGCGATFWSAWDECDCALGKPTVEFRVFNGTANTRKVRAYTALSLALVGYAAERPIVEGELAIHPWRGSTQIDEDASGEVLGFILNDLPLTDAERADVTYCAANSMMGGPGSLAAVL